ncbi:MAG: LPS-assembly protein LptD [Burkholderiales bacterium]|jgi:LPS-assembly protein|nr:LPS-assembly protein LptD [Burkholderiales bacterium]
MSLLKMVAATAYAVILLFSAFAEAQTLATPFTLRTERELAAPNGGLRTHSGVSLDPKTFSSGASGQRGMVFLRADATEGNHDVVEATGNVELRAQYDTVLADFLRYDRSTDTIHARGNVVVRRQGSWVTGPEIDYVRDQATGELKQPLFYVEDVGGRGDAERLEFAGPDLYNVIKSRFTTCAAPREDWFLMADKMKFDTQRSVGTAYGASLRFMNVPLFYTPWFEFPLSNKRKSGFLTPSYGTSNARGIEFSVPYYWNIAPNYDATIMPRLMSKRGLQLNGQFRYLFGGKLPMQGIVEGEYLRSDNQTGENRYLVSWKHSQGLLPWMTAYADVNKVSDDTYFADLADRIAVTSQTTLPREAGLRMWRGPFSALLRVQNFQTLQDPREPTLPPYNRAPQVLVNMSEWTTGGLRDWGLSLSGLAEYARFNQWQQPYEGERSVIHPTITWKKQTLGWFAAARAGVQQRNYWLNNDKLAVGHRRNPSATIPMFSLDSGLIFEREGSLWGHDYVQTLEPRLFYVYIPHRNQNDHPIFDTTVDDFSFSQLFRENRYLGNDRIGDASQLTTALTSRILSENGAEILRIYGGQRFYFSDQRVTMPGESLRSADSSDFLFGVEGRLSSQWSASMFTQYNFDQNESERFNFSLRWSPKPGHTLAGSWRYTKQVVDTYKGLTSLKQFDLAGQWPVSERWNLVARWNYSLEDSKTLEALGGVEYNAGCWILRAVIHQLATTIDTTNISFFLQFEFNGLGRIGSSPMDVLRRSIPGYTTASDLSQTDNTPTYSIYPEF